MLRQHHGHGHGGHHNRPQLIPRGDWDKLPRDAKELLRKEGEASRQRHRRERRNIRRNRAPERSGSEDGQPQSSCHS